MIVFGMGNAYWRQKLQYSFSFSWLQGIVNGPYPRMAKLLASEANGY